MTRALGLLLATFLVVASSPLHAQPWPAKPVHVVVSSGAGGTADILGR